MIFRVVLNEEISLCYCEAWSCGVCGKHHYFGFERSEPQCVMCEFDRTRRDQLMVAGWNMSRSAEQVVLSRVPRAKLGS